MQRILVPLMMVVFVFCGDSGPEATIDTVDQLLAAICEEAAECPGISATQQEIDACPTDIRLELSASQIAEMEQFVSYTRSQQDCILACIGGSICDRFGEALSNISDSDALEPLQACEPQCL